MKLHKKQKEAILNKSRYKVYNWGRRSGKTTTFGYEAQGTALTINNAKVTYYAQTFDDARSIAWDIFLEILGGSVIEKNETRLEITIRNIHGGTSMINLKGWESVYQSGKGRGTENDLVLCDEVAFCRAFIENWEKVLAPTLLTTKGRAVFGSTPNGYNDFHRLADKAKHTGDWWYSHATSYDNEFNDPVEIDKIKAQISEDRFAQEYMADFRKLSGAVYKEFDIEKQGYNDGDLINKKEEIAGIDWGFKNPAAMLRIFVDNEDNYWVDEEYYKTGKITDEIIEYLNSWKPDCVYPDPAEPDRNKMLSDAGYYVKDVNKEIVAGIDKVRELFRNKRIRVNRKCVNLIWELENYQYDGDSTKEKPLKENDHLMDALRYALFMHAPKKNNVDDFMFEEEPLLYPSIGM